LVLSASPDGPLDALPAKSRFFCTTPSNKGLRKEDVPVLRERVREIVASQLRSLETDCTEETVIDRES